jgi:hypothetical protein
MAGNGGGGKNILALTHRRASVRRGAVGLDLPCSLAAEGRPSGGE